MNPGLPSRDFPRPRLVLSRCLEVEACRYNGRMIRSRGVRMLEPWVEWVPVCPEVEVGLGVPRDPIRLVRGRGTATGLVQPSTGRDLTAEMTAFRERFLDGVGEVDGFLLKNRSPSCGIDGVDVFAGPDDAAVVGREPGMFAAAVLDRFPDWPVEDEGSLADPDRRDRFLTRIFALADLRRTRTAGRAADLVDFQARHKLMLMAQGPGPQRELGRRVARAAGRPPAEVFADYGALFRRTLAREPSPGQHLNAIQHAQGYFRDRLTREETHGFLALQEAYRQGRARREALLDVLRGWTARWGEPYLARQTYLQPYPPALAEVAPPGSG